MALCVCWFINPLCFERLLSDQANFANALLGEFDLSSTCSSQAFDHGSDFERERFQTYYLERDV